MRAQHHRLAMVALVAATGVLITACQPLHLTRPPGSGTVRYRDAVFTQVDTTSDVTYGKATRITGSIQTLKLDVYQPRAFPANYRRRKQPGARTQLFARQLFGRQ